MTMYSTIAPPTSVHQCLVGTVTWLIMIAFVCTEVHVQFCPQLVKWGLSKLPPTSQVGSIQILLTKGTPKVIENGVVACVHVT